MWSGSLGWRIEFGDSAKKQLGSLDRQAAKRIIEYLRTRVEAVEDPRRIGSPLKGVRFGNLWRYRVGDYRIIATIEDAALRVLVVKVGHRRDVYD